MRKYIKKIMVMIVVIIFLLGICISKNEYMQNDTSQSLYLQLSNASEFVLNKIGTKFRYQEKKKSMIMPKA